MRLCVLQSETETMSVQPGVSISYRKPSHMRGLSYLVMAQSYAPPETVKSRHAGITPG
jgi:hypothetical protein